MEKSIHLYVLKMVNKNKKQKFKKMGEKNQNLTKILNSVCKKTIMESILRLIMIIKGKMN